MGMWRHLPLVLLAGCGVFPADSQLEDGVYDLAVADAAPPPPATAITADQFDTTTDAQRAAAADATDHATLLGRVVATLGDPSRPGFWAETPLVTGPAPGRLVEPESGKTAEVDLLPIGAGGTRVSLAALRLLDVPLTALAELDVYAR